MANGVSVDTRTGSRPNEELLAQPDAPLIVLDPLELALGAEYDELRQVDPLIGIGVAESLENGAIACVSVIMCRLRVVVTSYFTAAS